MLQQGPLLSMKWDRVILDEAHNIRNYKSLQAQAVFLLKARHRWALTGTPVNNKELDFYSLLKFLRCHPFDDLLVRKVFSLSPNINLRLTQFNSDKIFVESWVYIFYASKTFHV
jgi:SNF2 family DNA or RNA helicase